MNTKLSKSFAGLCLILLLVLFNGSVSAQRLFDSEHLISMEPSDGWVAVLSENAGDYIATLPATFLHFIGADPREPGLILFKTLGEYHLQEAVPNIQIAVHDFSGLSLRDADLDVINRRLEELYSEKIGSKFRKFVLERKRIAGTSAIRLTGVYPWNTVNIKILQYLIPGSGHLYSVTYTAKEMVFPTYLQEAEKMFETLSISDPPLEIGWLWDLLRLLALLGLIAIVIFGVLYATSIRPTSPVSGLLRSLFGGSDKKDSSKNPFLKR